MIFMLVVLAPVAVQWPKGAGRQVSDASGFEEGGREPGKRPETPPGGSPATPGLSARVRCAEKLFQPPADGAQGSETHTRA